MRYLVRLIAITCVWIAVLEAGPARAERRLALAVGIDAYDHLPAHEQLRKAVNDARAVGAALRALGFDATVEENLPRLAFVRAWQRFLNRLEPGDTAALFFAGHGVEVGGLNFLLPRDVPKVVPGEDQVLAEASIRFNGLMDNLRDKKVRVALFIVDACRDNPFRDGRGRSVGGTRGLARIEAAKGSFVMYSAGAGEQALDRLSDVDPNPNSVYTRTLLPILNTPGLSLPEIAGRVRRKVVEVARGAGREQTPAYYDELLGEFVLKAGSAADGRPDSVLQAPSSDAGRAWVAAKESASVAVLEAFRRQYGAANAFYDRLAEARIEELRRQQLALINAEEERKRAETDPLRPGHVFRDCRECPEMVVVPAGSFMMGSPPGEPGHEASEGPRHTVTIARPFAVGKFEVTFADWDACVAERGCTHRPSDQSWGRGRRPAIDVSWNDATQQYLPWLSRKAGKTYRLLTEAEWEYAARAGATARYHFGDNERDLCTFGNVADLTGKQKYTTWEFVNCRDGHIETAPVGSFRPNAFGLHDVHGNVWEWVQDCWNDNYDGAPSDGSARTTGNCGHRVVRGGSWGHFPRYLRASGRKGDPVGVRWTDYGFRIARTL